MLTNILCFFLGVITGIFIVALLNVGRSNDE